MPLNRWTLLLLALREDSDVDVDIVSEEEGYVELDNDEWGDVCMTSAAPRKVAHHGHVVLVSLTRSVNRMVVSSPNKGRLGMCGERGQTQQMKVSL